MTLLAAGGPAHASSNDPGPAPDAAGIQLLRDRETALAAQSERALAQARRRALLLYEWLEAGAHWPPPGGVPPLASTPVAADGGEPGGGQGLTLATSVLARDLREAGTLLRERRRAHDDAIGLGSQARSVGEDDLPSSARPTQPSFSSRPSAALPAMVKPVKGPLLAPFGVASDPATGAWFFRAGASFRPLPPGSAGVRSPCRGLVLRVEHPATRRGTTLVLDAGGGLTVIVEGLSDTTTVTPGVEVGAGDRLGDLALDSTGSPLPVRMELWRGRAPLDPTPLWRAGREAAGGTAGRAASSN